MRKIWDKIVEWFLSIPTDKRLHFACGLVIAAFFAIALDMKLCFWPVFFFAFGKELFDASTGGKWDWWDFLATMLGSLVPQAFVLLHLWWFPVAA